MEYINLFINLAILITTIILLFKLSTKNDNTQKEIRKISQETISSVLNNTKAIGDILMSSQKNTTEIQDKRLSELNTQLTQRQDTLQKTVNDMLVQIDQTFKSFSAQSEQKLENIRNTVETRLTLLQEDNSKKLEQMRATVDEKLQKTLEDRIAKSFSLVSERLEQVYKGLGEMQTLAIGVGDLKKVLSNVKTRGILGEIQLGAILEQILSKEQYEVNIVTKKGTSNPVEYAVKLPGDENGFVYLPIDSKFPADTYSALVEAYEAGNSENIEKEISNLEKTIKVFAKCIHDKYIDPPNTTDFGIMFLPFEGLYAEVVRRGMVETLQREYKINVAGPTTMAALLNSLQMGFKTLAIQKRTSEVWTVLGAVKTEFDKFADVLMITQQRLEQAHLELDKLVGVRTRKIQSKLRNLTTLPEEEVQELLDE